MKILLLLANKHWVYFTSFTEYDPAYYDGIERSIAAEIAEDEATIGDIDTSLRLDPCEDCPLVGFPIGEADRRREGTRATSGVEGLEINVQYETSDGRCSSEIILGYHDKNSIGGKRQAKIYEEAARRTHECKGPRKVPRFLGPLAVKRCSALKGRKARRPDFIG